MAAFAVAFTAGFRLPRIPAAVDASGGLRHTAAMTRRWLLVLWLWLPACGAANRSVATDTPRRDVINLDPIEIKTDRGGGKPLTYVRDHNALVDQAMAEFHAAHWPEAVRLFEILMREFPEAPGAGAIAHNSGLALQTMGQHPQAALQFARARLLNAGTRQARDALFLQAESLELAGDVSAAATLYVQALDDPATQQQIGGELGILDALEAAARAGLNWRAAGEIKNADDAFRRVERLYNDNREVQVVGESEWVARAAFERGELYREIFASIRFKLPVERMKRDLEDKANVFLKAENSYYRCVRMHHAHWSLAAGHNIGGLYTRLIDDIDNAEVPPEVGEQLADMYRDELWNHTEKLAKRAIIIYRKNIELGKQLGAAQSDWVSKSEAGLSRMMDTIDRNQARRARLLRAGVVSEPTANKPAPATR